MVKTLKNWWKEACWSNFCGFNLMQSSDKTRAFVLANDKRQDSKIQTFLYSVTVEKCLLYRTVHKILFFSLLINSIRVF